MSLHTLSSFCASHRWAQVVFAISGSLAASGVTASALDGAELIIPLTSEGESRPITSLDLVTAREIGGFDGTGLSVSPDGELIAFEVHQADLAANGYRVAWFVAPTASLKIPVNVGDAGDATLFKAGAQGLPVNGSWITQAPEWSPDSEWIVYRKKSNEETQLWRSRRDGLIQEQLTHSSSDVEEFQWSTDGTKIYFATDVPRVRLVEIEEAQAKTGHLFDYENEWATFHGKPYRDPHVLSGGKPLIWAYDWASRQERRASEEESAEYQRLSTPQRQLADWPGARSISVAADDRQFAWLQPADRNKQGARPPLTVYASRFGDGRDWIACKASECTGQMLTNQFIEGLWWDAAGTEIYFVRREGKAYGTSVLYGWRVGEDHVRPILETDEWISDCSQVGGRAICFRQTADYPRTIVAINLADGTIATIVDPNPEFSYLRRGKVERFDWEDESGHKTFGFLVLPLEYESGKRYPLVIAGYHARHTFYGGVGHEYPVHQLAANGFAVLVYERPLDWEVQAVEADQRALYMHDWGPDMFDYRTPLSLFESAIDKLSKRQIVDPNSVGIAGFSNGATHVAYSLIHSDRFAAAAISWSVYNPCVYFVGGVPGRFRRDIQNHTGVGRPGGGNDWKWKQISLALNAHRVSTPLLIQTSDFEHIRALQDVIMLTEAGKPVEMHVFPNEFHVKWEPAHRLSAYQRSFDWFNFWLRGVEDLDSENANQYRRWRRLRDHKVARRSGAQRPQQPISASSQ